MNIPRSLTRLLPAWRKLHKALTICALVSLLAGLIPPPLLHSALPQPAAELAEALLPAPSVAQAAGGAISGTVFQDYNGDGVRNTTSTTALPAVDNGVGDVTVTAYDADGSQCGQTTTSMTVATLGQYTLNHTCNAATVRVEFTGLPASYQSGPQGTNSGTSVQFVSATASNVNYGINAPCDYCQATPKLVLNYMVSGNQLTNSGATTRPDTKIVVAFDYNSSGDALNFTGLSMAKQVGTTVGLAYQRSSKTIFVASYMKRHAGFGPGGPGAIYQVKPGTDGIPGTADDVTSTFLDLDDAAYFGANSFGTDPHPTTTEDLDDSPYNWFHDRFSLDDVGKMSFGDLDVSEDDQTLYTINLYDRALYRLPIGATGTAPAKADIITVTTPITLPNSGANALTAGAGSNQHQSCTEADVRPFGLGVYGGKVYVGLVCSALSTQTASAVRAYVYAFDPATNAFAEAPALEFPLNYTRAGNFTTTWKPWNDTFNTIKAGQGTDGNATFEMYPQPMLADIAFHRGQMVLGFRDRAGDQVGKNAGDDTTDTSISSTDFYYLAASGDILRACTVGNGRWEIENNGRCTGFTTDGGGSGSNEGPGGGEFYSDSAPFGPAVTGTPAHAESSQGMMAQVGGFPEVTLAAIDPYANSLPGDLNSAGVQWLNNTTGAVSDAYKIFQGTAPTSTTPDPTFGKAGGIGDIEALCDPAPIQIGNRVWNDANSNGLQDADESPIQNVTVELYKAGTKIGQATTNAQGEYYFTSGASSSDSNTNDNTIHDGGIGIRSGTGTVGGDSDYELRIPDVTGGSKQAALGTNVLTTANAGSKETTDSDGTIPSGQSYASYVIPQADLTGAGYNNHTYDFGFGPQPTTGTIQIVKNTVGADGAFDFISADTQLDAVSITTVGNTGNSGAPFTKNAGTYTISEDALPANWALTSLSCTGDTDNGSVVTLASQQVAIDLDSGENIVCTFTNTYTAPPTSFGAIEVNKTVNGDPAPAGWQFTLASSNCTLPGGLTNPATTADGAGGSVSWGNLPVDTGGTACLYSVSETAQSGYMLNSGASDPLTGITISANLTTTVAVVNDEEVAPPAPTGTSILTITKAVIGSSDSGPYTVTVAGPGGSLTTTTVLSGTPTVLTGLANGVYTVTETSPGAGWVTTYTVGSVSSSLNGIVKLPDIASTTAGPISGKVYHDYNSDGQITNNAMVGDDGLAGVIVTAYDQTGAVVGIATTDGTGAYTINPSAAGPYRIEFTNLPAGYEPTRRGSGNGTTTQFVTTAGGAANVNLGVSIPAEYCQDNPLLATSCYLEHGQPGQTDKTLYTFPYNAGCVDDNLDGVCDVAGQSVANPTSTQLAQAQQVGTTWGLAYQRQTDTLYAAAFMKRHAGFRVNGATGIIYRTSGAAQGAPSLATHVDLDALGFDTGTDPHPADNASLTTWETDANSWDWVGKMSLGGLELSADGNTLWTINLFARKLYAIPAQTTTPLVADDIDTYVLPTPGDCTTPATNLRPFAVKLYQGLLYIGMTCTAETTQAATDLRAYVYSMDPAVGIASFTEVLNIPLNYPRTCVTGSPSGTCAQAEWKPWKTTFALLPTGVFNGEFYYPQPWLTDIEFDGDAMILGIRDRVADQSGFGERHTNGSLYPIGFQQFYYSGNAGGDTLRACLDTNDDYVLENNGSCGGITTAGQVTGANSAFYSGPGNGQYYYEEHYPDHQEISMGGLAQLAGGKDVVTTGFDPIYNADKYFDGGVLWMRNASGDRARAWIAFSSDNSAGDPYVLGTFAKAGGLGDLELLCNMAPLEIGNRVWDDLDGDGVQDPGEPGLNGVTVSLQAPTGTVGTVNTSGDGNYYFGNLSANTAYTITINTMPTGYSLTTPNAAALNGASVSSNHAISDTRDSDAALVGGVATIYYTTGSAGQNNHGLDIGFTHPAMGQVDILNIAPVLDLRVSIGNLVWEDGNDNGLYDTGEDLIDNLTMELWLDLDNDSIAEPLGDDGSTPLSTTVTVNGIYSFTELLPGAYFVRIPNPPAVTPLSSIPSDAPDNGVDNDDNGSQPGGPTTQILSPVIDLAVGDEPGTGGGGNDDMTVDFGLVDPFLGNLVWHDSNNDGDVDSGEAGIANVIVGLYYDSDNSNALEASETITYYRQTHTDGSGLYTFGDLVPGNYQVVIPQVNFATGGPLAVLSSSSTNSDSNDNQEDEDDNGLQSSSGMTVTGPLVSLAVDAEPTNADRETGRGNTLDDGDDNNGDLTIDFGFYEASGAFTLDKQVVSPASGVAQVGDPVIYALIITNTGGLTITTITLVDSYDADYLQYNSASINPTAQATGVLTWTLTSPTAPLPLSAGETMTVTVTFTAAKP